MSQEININHNLGDASLSQAELVIRTGQAEPIKKDMPVRIQGNIDSPFRWLEKRHTTIDPLAASVVVRRDDGIIMLNTEERSEYMNKIEGKLTLDEKFLEFGINSGNYSTHYEMATFFKMNRTYFENQDVAMKLVSQLQNFSAKVNKEIEKSNDNRGNTTDLKRQVVSSNLPANFRLFLPIYKGYPRRNFEVEVYIRPEDLCCTLISPEASDIIESTRDMLIDEQLDMIRELMPGLVILFQ